MHNTATFALANKDVEAWNALAQKAADYIANQKAADDARQQFAGLRQQIERLQGCGEERQAADKAEKANTESKTNLNQASTEHGLLLPQESYEVWLAPQDVYNVKIDRRRSNAGG